MELLRPYLLRGVCYACLRFLDPRLAAHLGGHDFHPSCLEYVLATQQEQEQEDEEGERSQGQ